MNPEVKPEARKPWWYNLMLRLVSRPLNKLQDTIVAW